MTAPLWTSKKIATALGAGTLGGVLGTAAITAAMLLETRVTGPDQSAEMTQVPAQAVESATGVELREERASPWIHWGYGTGWGTLRGALALLGLRGPKATLLHFAAISGAAATALPLLGIAPPPQKTPAAKMIAQTLNHLLYAIVAGVVCDAILGGEKP